MKQKVMQTASTPTRKLPTSFFKRILFVVRVEGESMLPKLLPGRYYLATNLKKPRVGSFVVFQNPINEDQVFVKEVESIKNGHFFVKGTVSWGTSSKEIGVVPPLLVLGVLLRVR